MKQHFFPKTLAGVVAGIVLLAPGAPSPAAEIPQVLVVGPMDSYGALVGGVSEGLQSAGFRDSTRIRIDIRNAPSADEATAAVRAAVDRRVDAIVTIFGPSTQAARAATSTIPIVFCPVADPVAAKFAASNEVPGGNLTGVASADAEASRRRLAAFHEVLPDLKRLAVLFDPGFSPDRVQMANLEQIASSAGITLLARPVRDENAAVAALRALDRSEIDAVLILKEALLRRGAEEIGGAAVEQKLPILVGDPDLVMLPAVVAAVGPNQKQTGRLCGQMVARVLTGAKPADLPVEHPVFELLINLKSARSLGVVVPERALHRAVRVIR